MLAFLKKDKGLFSYILVLISDRLIGLCLIYFLVRSISDEYFAYWTQVNFLPGALCGILSLGLGRGVLRLLVDNEYSKKLVRNILMTICIIFIFVSLSSYLIIIPKFKCSRISEDLRSKSLLPQAFCVCLLLTRLFPVS